MATVGDEESKSKALATLSLQLDSAEVTVKLSSTICFAKDKNEGVLVWFEASDLTLNDVA